MKKSNSKIFKSIKNVFNLDLILMFLSIFLFLIVFPTPKIENDTLVFKNKSLLYSILNTEDYLPYKLNADLGKSVQRIYKLNKENSNEEIEYEIIEKIYKQIKNRVKNSKLNINLTLKYNENESVLIFTFPEFIQNKEDISELFLKRGNFDFYAIKLNNNLNTNQNEENNTNTQSNNIDFQPMPITEKNIIGNIRFDYSSNLINENTRIGTYLILNLDNQAREEFFKFYNKQYSILMDIEGLQFRLFPFDQDPTQISTNPNTVRAILINEKTENEKLTLLNILKTYFMEKTPLENNFTFAFVEEKKLNGIINSIFIVDFLIVIFIVFSVFFQRIYAKYKNNYLKFAFFSLIIISLSTVLSIKVLRINIGIYTIAGLFFFLVILILLIYRTCKHYFYLQSENKEEFTLKDSFVKNINVFWISTFILASVTYTLNISTSVNDFISVIFLGSFISFLLLRFILKNIYLYLK